VDSTGASRLKQLIVRTSPAELEEAAFATATELGFRYFAYCGCFSQYRSSSRKIRFDNLPAGWRRYCRERGIPLLPGPLHRIALQEVTPVTWSIVAKRHRKAFDKAAAFGLAAGITHCVHGPRGQWSLSSFVLDREGAASDRLVLETLPDCHLVACAIHHAASRIVRRELEFEQSSRRSVGGPSPDLSDRERQCLARSAQGRTTVEIGHELQISERTVAFHLANVRRKLKVANSRHAVSRAISLKLIGAA
jgi:DNA-binding CsgD family transcriptional regulator